MNLKKYLSFLQEKLNRVKLSVNFFASICIIQITEKLRPSVVDDFESLIWNDGEKSSNENTRCGGWNEWQGGLVGSNTFAERTRVYDVVRIFMKNWDDTDENGVCTATEDYKDVAKVAKQISIPLLFSQFRKEYWDRVFEYFLAEYRAGQPNPDVILATKEIKLKAFLDYCMDLGAELCGNWTLCSESKRMKMEFYPYTCAEWIATKTKRIFEGQLLSQKHNWVNHVPLWGVVIRTRAIAERNWFSKQLKEKDSTGVCFIGEKYFKQFLSNYLPARKGNMVTLDGEVKRTNMMVLMYYTIGQRQGLGDRWRRDLQEPWFVVGKDLATNTFVWDKDSHHQHCMRIRLEASQIHFTADTDRQVNSSAQPNYVIVKDVGVSVRLLDNDRASDLR